MRGREIDLSTITDPKRLAKILSKREYYQRNKERICAEARAKFAACPDLRAKRSAITSEWQKNNRAIVAAKARRWRARHLELARVRMRAYHKARILRPGESEKDTARTYRWRTANPERSRRNLRKQVRTRRAKLAGAVGQFTVQQWMWRVAYYGWRCVYCQCTLTEDTLTLDHKIPVSRGGSNWPANLAPACDGCNKRKNRKTFTEFIKLRAGLP